jgi:hypothetical protein
VGGTGQWVLAHTKKNLFDSYGKIPEGVRLLSLDTTRAPSATVGGWGNVGDDGGRVVDLGSEHVWVGGDAYDYAISIRDRPDKFPHLASWFDADWFLRTPGARGLLNLTIGAGKFRPLGRLATFYNLTQGANSPLRNALNTAIQDIVRETGQRNVYAFLVGSLAGGTGAGMFADVAHLLRVLAVNLQASANIRGYFVLPQAFDGTVDAGVTQIRADIVAKSFAAMRENSRFASVFDFAAGYPVFYAGPDDNDPVLHEPIRSTLFELLYYFDGKRAQNTLEQVRIENGVAPTIADAIAAMIDDRAGHTLEEHKQNVTGDRNALNLTTDIVTVGALGTYSWVFPIYDIIEGWTHELASEVLDQLLPLEPQGKVDERTFTPTGLDDSSAGGRVSKNGVEAARAFWGTPDIGGIRLGALPRELGKLGEQWQSEEARQQVINSLQTKMLDEWLALLAPQPGEDSTVDREIRPKIEKLLKEFLNPQTKGSIFRPRDQEHAAVLTTDTAKDKAEQKSPALGAERVRNSVTEYFNSRLGRLDVTENRAAYPVALVKYTEWQVERFRQALDRYVRDTLNGTAANDPRKAVENRSGKLGHLRMVLAAINDHLDGARQAIEKARTEKQRAGGREGLDTQRSRAYQQMLSDANKQEVYLKICQSLLELDRWDVTARVAAEAAGSMQTYVVDLRKVIKAWIDALAFDPQGVFAEVQRGRQRIKSDRAAAGALSPVRNVINDQKYEDLRYHAYTSGEHDAVAEVLADLEWEVKREQLRDPRTRELVPYLGVNLKLHNVKKDDGTFEDRLLAAEPVPSNRDALLRRCRQEFVPAREHESISAYLMFKYDGKTPATAPEVLADEIFAMNGPLLRQTGNPVPYNYLRVHQDPALQGQQVFLTRVIGQLARRSLVPPTRASQIINSDDRFRLSFLYFWEVIAVERTTAYTEAQKEYGLLDVGRRQVHHIFPAERNIVLAERRIGRLLPHRVVQLVEEPGKFNLAVMTRVYGRRDEPVRLLHLCSYEDQRQQRRTVWRLTRSAKKNEYDPGGGRRQDDHYFLTIPGQEPSLLNAFETFTMSEKVKWFQLGKGVPRSLGDEAEKWLKIPLDEIAQQVQEYQKEDLQKRLDQGTLGTRAIEFQGKLGAVKGRNLSAVQLLVAQFERIQEIIEDLTVERSALDENSVEYCLYLLIEDHLKTRCGWLRDEINRY